MNDGAKLKFTQSRYQNVAVDGGDATLKWMVSLKQSDTTTLLSL